MVVLDWHVARRKEGHPTEAHFQIAILEGDFLRLRDERCVVDDTLSGADELADVTAFACLQLLQFAQTFTLMKASVANCNLSSVQSAAPRLQGQ